MQVTCASDSKLIMRFTIKLPSQMTDTFFQQTLQYMILEIGNLLDDSAWILQEMHFHVFCYVRRDSILCVATCKTGPHQQRLIFGVLRF